VETSLERREQRESARSVSRNCAPEAAFSLANRLTGVIVDFATRSTAPRCNSQIVWLKNVIARDLSIQFNALHA